MENDILSNTEINIDFNTELTDFENLPSIMYGENTIEYLKSTV